jgi:hypothetical protein
MALTAAQEISLYKIMGIPYSTTYTVHDGMGTGIYSSSDYVTTYYTIKAEITAFLASLASGVETAIQALIVEYDAIALSAVAMQSGSVGSINGVTVDFEAKRQLIRNEMEILVPFIAKWRAQLRQSVSGSKTSVVSMVR